MIIQINDKFRINRLDDLNWAVDELKTRKKDGKNHKAGDTYWEHQTYHANCGAACVYYIHTHCEDSQEEATLAEYAEILKRRATDLKRTINDMLESAGVNYR
jgi:hypothetical protein